MFWIVLLGFFGLLLLAGGAVLSLYARRSFRTAEQLGRPLNRIGKLRPGFRKVRGKIAAIGKPLRSPVGDKECVYYRLQVKEERKSYIVTLSATRGPIIGGGTILSDAMDAWHTEGDRAVHSWHTLLDDTHDVSLTVEDDTGCVEVDLSGAAVLTKEKKQIVAGGNHPPPSRLEETLRAEHGIHSVDERGFFKTLLIVEEVLLVGAKVTIAGTVEELESGDLCFQADSDPLVVSEGDLAKQKQSAHTRAMGFAASAGAAMSLGLGCLVVAVVVIMRASLAR